MKKRYWVILFLGWFQTLSASHIVGGHFEVTQLNDTLFKIDLIILRDCSGILPREVYSVRVFNRDSTLYKNVFLELQDPELMSIGDSCFSPLSLCIEKYIATDTVVLNGGASGYFLVAQEFARNANIANITPSLFSDGIGMTFLIEIPSEKLPLGNSTPVFHNYPPNGYLCIHQLKTIDFSATDPDGDSLHYRLVTPLEGHPDASVAVVPQLLPKFPPYPLVTWAPGFSLAQVTPGDVPLEIHANTGVVEASPDQFGLFVFSYAVDEFRNGVKIGEVRRDLQLEVLHCFENLIPEFTKPEEPAYTATVGSDFCFDVVVTDPNEDDTILLSSSFMKSLTGLSEASDVKLTNNIGKGTANGEICWQPSCEETFAGQELNFTLTAVSYGCDGIDTVSKTVNVVIDPIPEQVLDLFPNIFTPNGDGINDYFRLKNDVVYPCLSQLRVRIYNRWGVEVYENTLNNPLGWDGKFDGNEVPDGVYYYIVSGNYNDQALKVRNSLTLMR